jgi:hypothetical protein
MPLWSTTMKFERLLLKSIAVMRTRIRIEIDHNVTKFKLMVKGKLTLCLSNDHPESNTAIFGRGARERLQLQVRGMTDPISCEAPGTSMARIRPKK